MGQWLEINQWIFMGRKPRFYSLGISIPLSKFASSYISILYCEAIISGSRIICGPRQYYDLYSCQEQFHKKFSRGREGGGVWYLGVAESVGYTRGRYYVCSLVSLMYNDIFLSLFYLERQLLAIKMK